MFTSVQYSKHLSQMRVFLLYNCKAIKDTCKRLSAEKENLENRLATKGETLHTATQLNERLMRENHTLKTEGQHLHQTTQELQVGLVLISQSSIMHLHYLACTCMYICGTYRNR